MVKSVFPKLDIAAIVGCMEGSGSPIFRCNVNYLMNWENGALFLNFRIRLDYNG